MSEDFFSCATFDKRPACSALELGGLLKKSGKQIPCRLKPARDDKK
jgi:hypothetical protein